MFLSILGGFATLFFVQASATEASPGPQYQVPLSDHVDAFSSKVIRDEFSDYVERMMGMWEVKGTSIAVVHPGGEVEFGSWGIRSEDGDNMTSNTLLNIGSCSKAFLASSLGILMNDFQHGRNETPLPPSVKSFNWDTKLKDILPGEWQLQDEWAYEKASILDILTHRSGVPRHDASYNANDTSDTVLQRMKYLRPAHELRQKYAYNNMMYTIGSHIVSRYSSTQNYAAFVSERIFAPLGMDSTVLSPSAANRTGRLSQSWTAHGQLIPYWFLEETSELSAGPGGVVSTAEDLSKWMKMLINKGVDPTSNKTILPSSVFDAVTTSHTIVNGKAVRPELSISGYGMGWGRLSIQGHELISHGGAIPGFSSSVSFYPNDGLGIAVLLNGADKYLMNSALAFRVAEDVLNLTRHPLAQDPREMYPPRPSRPSDASSPIPLSSYTGTYSNPGYGNFTLCNSLSVSQYCARVIQAFAAVDFAHSLPLPPATSIPQLYAEWDRVWSTHIRMMHFNDTTFDVAWTALFPEGYGNNKTAFETYEGDKFAGKADFVLDDSGENVLGFGFFGTDDPSMEHALSDETGNVEERAIVWFEKA